MGSIFEAYDLKRRVTVDLEKFKAVMEWPTPRNVTKVKSFMGMLGYYRRFIQEFLKIGHLITTLQRKWVKFQWTLKCTSRFWENKYLLRHVSILRIIDPKKDFLVCTDACKDGFGGVLMQDEHVIFYESRKLNENEINCHPQFRTHNNNSCIKNVESLLDRVEVHVDVGPCGIEIFIWPS